MDELEYLEKLAWSLSWSKKKGGPQGRYPTDYAPPGLSGTRYSGPEYAVTHTVPPQLAGNNTTPISNTSKKVEQMKASERLKNKTNEVKNKAQAVGSKIKRKITKLFGRGGSSASAEAAAGSSAIKSKAQELGYIAPNTEKVVKKIKRKKKKGNLLTRLFGRGKKKKRVSTRKKKVAGPDVLKPTGMTRVPPGTKAVNHGVIDVDSANAAKNLSKEKAPEKANKLFNKSVSFIKRHKLATGLTAAGLVTAGTTAAILAHRHKDLKKQNQHPLFENQNY